MMSGHFMVSNFNLKVPQSIIKPYLLLIIYCTYSCVVTHESTQNEIYLHNYEITCNLFFIVEYH